MPTLEDRKKIIEKEISEELGSCRLEPDELQVLGESSNHFSCRDLVHVISAALRRQLHEDIRCTTFISATNQEGEEIYHAVHPEPKLKKGLLKKFLPSKDVVQQPRGFTSDISSLPEDSLRLKDCSFQILKEVFRKNVKIAPNQSETDNFEQAEQQM